MKTENLSTLKIHKLTQDQFNREKAAGKLDPTALYLTPDAVIPTITAEDEGKVLMVVNGQLQLVALSFSVDENGVVSV